MLAMESAFIMYDNAPIPVAGLANPSDKIITAIRSIANIGQGEAYVVGYSAVPDIQ